VDEREIEELRRLMEPEKEKLHPDLRESVEAAGGKWPMLRHPMVYSVPYSEDRNAKINRLYEFRLQRVKELEEEGRFDDIIWQCYERPYRLAAFTKYADHFDDRRWLECLMEVWQDSENIWQNRRVWGDLLKRAKLITTDAPYYDGEVPHDFELPDILRVYRGYSEPSGEALGLSWTMDPDRAVWFARRFATRGERPMVALGTITGKDVIAVLMGREENEVVVLPEDLRRLSWGDADRVVGLRCKGGIS